MLIDSVIGAVALVLTIFGLIPKQPPYGKVNVKIWLGRDGKDNGRDLSEAGGDIPWIALFDTTDKMYGSWTGTEKLGSNNQITKEITTSWQAELKSVALIDHFTDAICIAVISWTPNGEQPNYEKHSGVITGDLLYFCGVAWNHSGQKVGDNDVYARCAWMSSNRNQVDFAKRVDINTNIMSNYYLNRNRNPSLCGQGVTITKISSSKLAKRGVDANAHELQFGNKVRVHKELSAIALCDSPTSWGSSFYSIDEEIFCDMSTKTKIPLCKNGDTTDCFVYSSVAPRSNSRGKRTRTLKVKGSPKKYDVEYLTITSGNGTIIDDGANY